MLRPTAGVCIAGSSPVDIYVIAVHTISTGTTHTRDLPIDVSAEQDTDATGGCVGAKASSNFCGVINKSIQCEAKV